LLSPDNKPWQLSYIIAEGNKVLKERDCYIYWPDLKLSEEARVITRFDDAKYSRLAKDPRAILEEFESYLYDEDYIIIGQNLLGFDVYIHGTYRKLLNIKPDFSYIGRIYDTNCIAKAIKKNMQPVDKKEFIGWQYQLNDFRERNMRTSIKAQLKQYKIDFDENKLHDSIYDVQMNFKIFLKQIWQIEV
jgi:DNA polymerase III epsilon subunit-like protein